MTLGAVPASGTIGAPGSVTAVLTSGGLPRAGRRVTFLLGSVEAEGFTDANGLAGAVLTPAAPAGASELSATFSGEMTSVVTALGPGSGYAGSRRAVSFDVE